MSDFIGSAAPFFLLAPALACLIAALAASRLSRRRGETAGPMFGLWPDHEESTDPPGRAASSSSRPQPQRGKGAGAFQGPGCGSGPRLTHSYGTEDHGHEKF